MNIATDFIGWLVALPGDFLFLLLLPFFVAALGLLAARRETRNNSRGASARHHLSAAHKPRYEQPSGK